MCRVVWYAAATALLTANVQAVRADDTSVCRYGTGDEAISACSRLLVLNPKSAVAYANRGYGYNSKGVFDRAISDLDEAIRLDPKYSTAYGNRGLVYNGKGDYDRAISDLDKAIRLDWKDAVAYNNRGFAYISKGDYDRAISDLDQAIGLDPKYPSAYANRGDAYRNKRDYGGAVAEYDEVIRLDPQYAVAYGNRGNAYFRKGDYDRAIAASVDGRVRAIGHRTRFVASGADPRRAGRVCRVRRRYRRRRQRPQPFHRGALSNLETPGLRSASCSGGYETKLLARTNNAQEPFTYGSLPGEELYFREARRQAERSRRCHTD